MPRVAHRASRKLGVTNLPEHTSFMCTCLIRPGEERDKSKLSSAPNCRPKLMRKTKRNPCTHATCSSPCTP